MTQPSASDPLSRGEVTDLSAWNRFCGLIADGGGVLDHAGLQQAPGSRSSAKFYALEIERVDHHQRNSIPFLIDHCDLAGKSVLEFGGGTGGLAVALARAHVSSITAVEPVELNYQAGHWRARAYGVEGCVRFIHLVDTSRLPFPDGSFDAAICSSVLQYIPEAGQRQEVLQELARNVRRGGVVVIQATGNGLYPGGPHSSHLSSNLFPRRAARLGHDRGITYWEVAEVLEPLGFKVVAQGRSAIARWRARAGGRPGSLGRKVSMTIGIGMISLLATTCSAFTKAPIEAFLPYPDLVFRKL